MRKSKKDSEIGAVVSNFGFAFEVFKVIAHAVTAKGGTMKDLRRIVKEPRLQSSIADLLVVPTNFLAPVVYVQPTIDELNRRFPCDNTFAEGLHFEAIESCRSVSRDNREVAFEYLHMDCEASTEEILAKMDRLGFRPALYEELLSFGERYPNEPLRYRIAALGSVTNVNRVPDAAYLWGRYQGQISLQLGYLCDADWEDDFRFLVVRK